MPKTVAAVSGYAEWAQSLWCESVRALNTETRLFLIVLGLGGEAAEAAEEIMQVPASGEAPAGVVKELGDAFFNWAVVAHYFGLTPSALFQAGAPCIQGNPEYHALRMLVAAGKVLEAHKKYVRDGVLNKPLLLAGMQDFVTEWRTLCALFALEPSQVLDVSIEKLESRRARGQLSGSGNDR